MGFKEHVRRDREANICAYGPVHNDPGLAVAVEPMVLILVNILNGVLPVLTRIVQPDLSVCLESVWATGREHDGDVVLVGEAEGVGLGARWSSWCLSDSGVLSLSVDTAGRCVVLRGEWGKENVG